MSDKVIIKAEWCTNKAVYSGRIIEFKTRTYIIKLEDGSIQEIDMKCVRIVDIIEI